VLEYFVGDAKSIRSRCLTARDTLVDKLVERYRHAMTSFFEEVYECSHYNIVYETFNSLHVGSHRNKDINKK